MIASIFRPIAVALAFALFATPAAIRAVPTLETYGGLPGFEMAALSPSGDRVAIVGVIGEQRRLIVTDRANKLLLSADVGAFKYRTVEWAGEDNVLLRMSKTVALGMGFTADKAELSNMIVVPVNGKPVWTVFQNNRSVTGGIRGYFGSVERQGRWYGYFGGMTLDIVGGQQHLMNTRADLYEVDMQTGKARVVARRADNREVAREWALAGDGSVAASMDFVTNSGDWTIRNRDRTAIASGKAPTGDIDLIGLGRTPETILYSQRDDNGVRQLFELPLAGGAAVPLLNDQATRGGLFDEHRRLLIGYIRDGDQPEDHFFDAEHERRMDRVRKAFPGKTVRLIDANAAFDRLIVRTDGPNDPQSWWVVDIASRAASPLGISYAIRESDVGPMRMYRYKAADGLGIGGVLTLPPNRDPKMLPVVILPHGGPQSRDYPVFDWWAQAYASRGYAVFQPNFRGSTGLGDAFRVAGYGEWGRKMQTDISDGLAALAKDGIVDPKRACIVGASYGGYAALAGVTLQQGLYRCAVSVAGVSDVQRLSITVQQRSGRDATLARALRAEIGSGRDLKLVSPVRFADRADAPILLIHGVDDTVVLFEQSQLMASALARAGKPYELVRLAGEDHWLSLGETRLNMLSAAISFVEKHNPPDAAPAP